MINFLLPVLRGLPLQSSSSPENHNIVRIDGEGGLGIVGFTENGRVEFGNMEQGSGRIAYRVLGQFAQINGFAKTAGDEIGGGGLVCQTQGFGAEAKLDVLPGDRMP